MHKLLHNRFSHLLGRLILGANTLYTLYLMISANSAAGFFGSFAAFCVANWLRLAWSGHIEPCNDGTTKLLRQLWETLDRYRREGVTLLLPSQPGVYVQMRLLDYQSRRGFLVEEQWWGSPDRLHYRFYLISQLRVACNGFSIARPTDGPFNFPMVPPAKTKMRATEVSGLLAQVTSWEGHKLPQIEFMAQE